MRIALIDGPLDPGDPAVVHAERLRPGDGPHARAHAAAMRAAVVAGCPGARLLSLGVFGAGLSTDAATVAAALDRAAALGAGVVLCAFGMGRRDEAIAAACARLLAAGAAVVAAAPARGGPCWPAALAGVASVQGDARCGPGDWSALGPPAPERGACPAAPDWGACAPGQDWGARPAALDWGACPPGPDPGARPPDQDWVARPPTPNRGACSPGPDWGACPAVPGHEGAAGASAAAAHFAGLLAARMAVNGREAALDALRRSATFQGRERRSAPTEPGTTGRDGRMP